jgi:TolA-binding protein
MVLRARYAALAGHPAEHDSTTHPRNLGLGLLRATPAATTTDQAAPVTRPVVEGLAVLAAPTAAPAAETAQVTRPAAKSIVSAAHQVALVASPGTPASPLLSPPQLRDDAAGVFAQAVAERQQGRAPMAIAAFRALQRRYPDSREATVSLVSLGDLLLGAGNPAEALLAFESYLLRAPAGTLVPEAMIGKARALAALGRTTEAASTWRAVVRQFPDSPYAQRALGVGTGGTSP